MVINGGNVYTIGLFVDGEAGIDADDDFEINGGEVVALVSDMLQSFALTSKQKATCFNLNQKISICTAISLKEWTGNEMISFVAKEDFKTLIVSNKK